MPAPYEYVIPKERLSLRLLGGIGITVLLTFFAIYSDTSISQYITAKVVWFFIGGALIILTLGSWWVKVGRRATVVRFSNDGIHLVTQNVHIPWAKVSAWMSTEDMQKSNPFGFIYSFAKPMGPPSTPTTIELLQVNPKLNNLGNSILRTIPVDPNKYQEITEALTIFIPRQAAIPQPISTFLPKKHPQGLKDHAKKLLFYISIGLLGLGALGMILSLIETFQQR